MLRLILIERNESIVITKEFGPYSYLAKHVILFHDTQAKEIVDGMKVGIDMESIDQRLMTKKACEGKKVEYVRVDYNQILEKIQNGSIDAAVWNGHILTDKTLNINYRTVDLKDNDDTEAVIVVNKNKPELKKLIDEIIDVDYCIKYSKAGFRWKNNTELLDAFAIKGDCFSKLVSLCL